MAKLPNDTDELVLSDEDARVARLLIDGAPPEAVRAELIAKGVPPERAAAIVSRQVEFQRAALQGVGGWAGRLLRMMGFVLMILGGCLMAGNRTGIFPTFPFSGLLALGVGGVVLVLGGGGRSAYPHLEGNDPGQAA